MSAGGAFMPLMLIFPRVKVNPEFLNDGPPGAWAEFNKSGWMQNEIFVRWFQKFIEFSQAKPEDPVLLLLDGHSSHVKNLKIIDLSMENGVIILCFPPHCTHKMQPLDVGFMGPLSIAFGKRVSTLQRQGVHMSMRNIFSVFGQAFLKAAKMETAVNSFKRCGISPFNQNIFSTSEFATAKNDTCSAPGENSSVSSTPRSAESKARIAQYSNIIEDIIHPSREALKPSQSSALTKENEQNQADDEIRIPLSYILQAKPLFNFLRPFFDGNSENIPRRDSESKHVRNQIPKQSQFDEQLENPPSETTGTPDAQGLTSSIDFKDTSVDENALVDSENASTPIQSISTSSTCTETIPAKVKKGRARGKAAIITDNVYKENLMAEKLKNMKKEKSDKKTVASKPVIKSNIPLELPLNVTTPKTIQPHKRKQPASNTARKKGEPLATLNHQAPQVPDLLPTDNQIYQIVDNSVVPIKEGTYMLPMDDSIPVSYFNIPTIQNIQPSISNTD